MTSRCESKIMSEHPLRKIEKKSTSITSHVEAVYDDEEKPMADLTHVSPRNSS